MAVHDRLALEIKAPPAPAPSPAPQFNPPPTLPIITALTAMATPPEPLAALIASTFTTSTLSFYLNGTPLTLTNADPGATLLDFIRSQRGLRGTKLGCGTGGCGACTVVVQQLRDGKLSHLCINACLAPLISGKSHLPAICCPCALLTKAGCGGGDQWRANT